MNYPTDINSMFESYKKLLQAIAPEHYRRFCKRERRDKDAVLAEAVMFTAMQRFSYRMKILEDVGEGGADFQCHSMTDSKEIFVLEATSLNSEAVSKKSGLENKVPEPEDGGAFSLVNELIWTKVSNKASQLANYDYPRVLAIFLNHFYADLFVGKMPISQLMTGETVIKVEIDNSDREAWQSSNLEKALFFRYKKGTKELEVCRQSISAVLLVTVDQNRTFLHGLLHPEPTIPFPINYLPEIPFCRMVQWPPQGGTLGVEWVTYRPEAATVHHFEADLERMLT